VLFSSVTVKIRFSVWLVGGYAHLFIVLSVVIVTLLLAAPAFQPSATRLSVFNGHL